VQSAIARPSADGDLGRGAVTPDQYAVQGDLLGDVHRDRPDPGQRAGGRAGPVVGVPSPTVSPLQSDWLMNGSAGIIELKCHPIAKVFADPAAVPSTAS